MQPLAQRVAQMKAAATKREHGSRAKYRTGCKCLPCRAANSRYNTHRELKKAQGHSNGIVDAAAARAHIKMLSRRGVGRRAVVTKSGVSKTIVAQIRSGERKHIREETERRILAVTQKDRLPAARVSGKKTWMLLDELIERGYTKTQLAHWLGCKSRGLQIKRDMVTVKTAKRVAELYQKIQDGLMRRD
jgi:hypothetical protein